MIWCANKVLDFTYNYGPSLSSLESRLMSRARLSLKLWLRCLIFYFLKSLFDGLLSNYMMEGNSNFCCPITLKFFLSFAITLKFYMISSISLSIWLYIITLESLGLFLRGIDWELYAYGAYLALIILSRSKLWVRFYVLLNLLVDVTVLVSEPGERKNPVSC